MNETIPILIYPKDQIDAESTISRDVSLEKAKDLKSTPCLTDPISVFLSFASNTFALPFKLYYDSDKNEFSHGSSMLQRVSSMLLFSHFCYKFGFNCTIFSLKYSRAFLLSFTCGVLCKPFMKCTKFSTPD
jgi:hypothetical protein